MCEHAQLKMVWLPAFQSIRYCGCIIHHYCTLCGLVKAEGSERGKEFGYFMNILGKLPKRTIKEVQCRQIATVMAREELFMDPFGSYLPFQLKRFVEIVTGVTGLVPEELVRAIESCT